MQNNEFLNENLEYGDLKRLVEPELHIDQYKSKMGDDADVCVLSFKVSGKEPATDLMAFVEKGYDYVLDADVSSGEKEGGDYLVFVEISRTPELPKQIYQLVSDVLNLTEQKLSDWQFKYRKSSDLRNIDEADLANIIPLTPEDYSNKYGQDQKEIDSLKAAAGVDVNTKAPVNDFTEGLRRAAGIR